MWINAVGRKGFIPSYSSRLCSIHFQTSDFYNNPGGSYKLTLKENAVPSVFQISIHSTLLPTRLFCNEPPIKKIKTNEMVPISSVQASDPSKLFYLIIIKC